MHSSKTKHGLYLLFHVVHPSLLWSHVHTLQSETSTAKQSKRLWDQSSTREFKSAVHQWTWPTLHRAADRKKGEDWCGERGTIHWDKTRRKEGWEPKKWYELLIMACPDIDANAGAHVRTCSQTPCEGLHWVNIVWSDRDRKSVRARERRSNRERKR